MILSLNELPRKDSVDEGCFGFAVADSITVRFTPPNVNAWELCLCKSPPPSLVLPSAKYITDYPLPNVWLNKGRRSTFETPQH